jgi:hypothetical protein
MGTPPGWGLEHRASNPVSVKNLTDIETSTTVKLRPYVPVGTKRTSKAWTIGVLGFDSRRGLGIFVFTTASRTTLGTTQPPIQWVPRVLSLGVKRSGRGADHSPHIVARSNNEWSYTFTPRYALIAWCSVKKPQGKLYLYLFYLLQSNIILYSPILFCQLRLIMQGIGRGNDKCER